MKKILLWLAGASGTILVGDLITGGDLSQFVGQVVIWVFNAVLFLVGGLGSVIMAVLPKSPFQALIPALDNDILATINWFIPLDGMVTILSAWVLAIALYYLYQIVMRWIKVIR